MVAQIVLSMFTERLGNLNNVLRMFLEGLLVLQGDCSRQNIAYRLQ